MYIVCQNIYLVSQLTVAHVHAGVPGVAGGRVVRAARQLPRAVGVAVAVAAARCAGRGGGAAGPRLGRRGAARRGRGGLEVGDGGAQVHVLEVAVILLELK